MGGDPHHDDVKAVSLPSFDSTLYHVGQRVFSSVVLDLPSCIKGVCDYYAAAVFQMGQYLEDSDELGIECGCKVCYSDMS